MEGVIDMRQPASGGCRSRDENEDGTRWPARAEPYEDTDGGAGLPPDWDARWSLAADARLDDRETLCDALGVPHRERAAVTDRTLILKAYRRWGEGCPNHLLGDYAFVVRDAETRTIFCARDHMGCRPFYYAWTRERFVFASTIEAVLAAPDVSDEWDEPVLAAYLTQIFFTTTTRTLFAAVRKLPPGHSLTVETTPSRGCSMRLERYWRPEGVPKARPAGDDDVAAEFLDLYAKAVKDRLRGGPVGVHLSGGLDSSSVAVLAAKELRRQGRPSPPAFTWLRPLDDEPPSHAHAPEYACIDAVAAREGLQVHYCQVLRPEDFVSLVRQDCISPELPSLIEERVCARAAKLGIRVLLSGLGGDEGVSFDGRGYYAELLLRGRWRQLAAEYYSAQAKNPVSFIARIVLQIVSPNLVRHLAGRRPPPRKRRFISPEFARRVRPLPEDRWTFTETSVRRTQLRLLQGGPRQGPILPSFLESFARQGAPHGIEYRYPLLDRRLLEFALGLPPTQFRRDRWNRWLMRSALAPILPSEVVWNPSKAIPILYEQQADTETEALPLIRREVAARIGTLDRASYVDVPRLLESLEASRFRSPRRPWSAPIRSALHVLDL